MISFGWPWLFLLLPLPWLARRLLPPATLPQGRATHEASRTVWLARSGVVTRVEVFEGEAAYPAPPLVERVEVVGSVKYDAADVTDTGERHFHVAAGGEVVGLDRGAVRGQR